MAIEKLKKEKSVDKMIEKTESKVVKSVETKKIQQKDESLAYPTIRAQVPKPSAPKDSGEELVIIKNILSEDIFPLYNQLSNAQQRLFRKRGEEVAIQIKRILTSAKVRVNELFELIKNWLKMLPKTSVYFLEQETKIKTDKMLELKRKGQIIEQ